MTTPASPRSFPPTLFKRRQVLRTGFAGLLGLVSSTCLARSQSNPASSTATPGAAPTPASPDSLPPATPLTPTPVPTPTLPPSATPRQTAGPFYPNPLPPERDADLTQVAGESGQADGQILYLWGQVRWLTGEPIAGALVEIWQTNARGRYNHPRDPNPAPLDPNFQGFGQVYTDAEGFYQFKTIRPAAYSMGGSRWRAPHIHVQVSQPEDGTGSRSGRPFTTQFYFAGEALNADDGLYRLLSPEEQAVVTIDAQPGSAADGPQTQRGRCDLILPT
ncbi:MAG: hypothetical protein ACO4CG_02930 [Prochlorothrix sp.]